MTAHSNPSETDILEIEVEKCEDIDDVRQIFNRFSKYYVDWKDYINKLVEEHAGFSPGNLAKLCGFSVNTVKKWCGNGDMPRSRKEFLKLGIGLGFNLDEINRLLQRYGKYHKLYAKNIEDAICIFSISNKLSFGEFEQLKKEFIEIYAQSGEGNDLIVSTEQIQSDILSLKLKQELAVFISDNYAVFSNAYKKLINFIDAYVKINCLDFTGTDGKDSLNALLEMQVKSPKLVAGFNDMVSELRRHKTIPDKSKLIAFGLYLNMTMDDVNLMLGMAGFEPLCAKDKLESVLIYALNNIALNNPGIELSNAILLEKYTTDKEIQRRCAEIIQKHYDCEFIDAVEYEEGSEKLRDVPDSEGFIEYIKTQIQDLEIENREDLFQFIAN
jgi:hypothetical protein